MTDSGEHEAPTINERTRVALGLLVILLGFLVTLGGLCASAVLYMENRFDKIEATLSKQDRRLERMEESGDRLLLDRWTYTDHKLWVAKFKVANPTLAIPDPAK